MTKPVSTYLCSYKPHHFLYLLAYSTHLLMYSILTFLPGEVNLKEIYNVEVKMSQPFYKLVNPYCFQPSAITYAIILTVYACDSTPDHAQGVLAILTQCSSVCNATVFTHTTHCHLWRGHCQQNFERANQNDKFEITALYSVSHPAGSDVSMHT